jgi:hypothetical protein
MPKKAKQAKKKKKKGPIPRPTPFYAIKRQSVGLCWRVLACSGVFFSLPLRSAAAAAAAVRLSPFALRVWNCLSRMQAKLQLHEVHTHTHTQLTEKHISSLVADKHRHTQKQKRKKK